MEVTLTKVFRTWKDKAGNDLVTKDGKKYERVSIKTQEHGDKWISGFGTQSNQNWKAGDKVTVVIEEKGQYLNFKAVANASTGDAELLQDIKRLALENNQLLRMLTAQKKTEKTVEEAPSEEINPDDIPF